MRRIEAALSPRVPGGQAVALDMLILLVEAVYSRIEKDIPDIYYFFVYIDIYFDWIIIDLFLLI